VSESQAPVGERNTWTAVRFIVLVNFLIIGLALLLSSIGGREVDSALREIGVDRVVASSLQMRLASSTLLATGFLVWAWHKNRRPGSLVGTRRSLAIDATLLLAWWLTVLGLCMYGFMLGMAG